MSAETLALPTLPAAAVHASMGPHFNECGNIGFCVSGATSTTHASMEPHFNECGNLVEISNSRLVIDRLQWGRTSMSAET